MSPDPRHVVITPVDGGFVASTPWLPGCSWGAWGETRDEAIAALTAGQPEVKR